MEIDGTGAGGSGRPPLAAGRAVWLAEQIIPHEPGLRRWLHERLALSAADADDIIQESYARLAELESVDHVREPRAYLFTVARSLVHQHLRRAQVVAIETVAELDGLGVEAPRASPERIVSSRQQLVQAQRLLEGLPGRCREVFRMRRIEGFSQREVAARLRISQSTVEKHMIRALRLLMAGLRTVEGGHGPDHAAGRKDRMDRTHGAD